MIETSGEESPIGFLKTDIRLQDFQKKKKKQIKQLKCVCDVGVLVLVKSEV